MKEAFVEIEELKQEILKILKPYKIDGFEVLETEIRLLVLKKQGEILKVI